MSMLINIPGRPLTKLIEKLSEHIDPNHLVLWPEVRDPDAIKFALVWKHNPGSLLGYRQLQGISSFGAGVDSILADQQLPDVPIARIVDPELADNMAKFVFTMIQHHKLRLDQFQRQKANVIWKPKSPHKGNKVGILGLGQLGIKTAELLASQGFDVAGWSRSEKQCSGIKTFTGKCGFNTVLAHSDYLICLLPLTAATENILNRTTLGHLPHNAVLINVARGEHLVDDDLIALLDTGQLDSAYLDVFRQEPLPTTHTFWPHPNIHITPHVSAVTNVETAVDQIVENYYRVMDQRPMINQIDREIGY